MTEYQMHKKVLLFSLMSTIWAVSSTANASWVSAGGEVGGHGSNPWFVANTNYIHYCVEIDEDDFSVDRPKVNKLIKRAIEFWKLDLSHSEHNRNFPMIQQGTQTFVLKQALCSEDIEPKADPCEVGSARSTEEDSIDLVFRFGSLSDQHLDKLKELELEPKKHIGFAMRTSYCSKSMRGKGFIYISPDRGENRYQLSNTEQTAEDPWALDQGARLLHVLIHELGHVFGIGHTSFEHIETIDPNENIVPSAKAYRSQVMNANFPEKMVLKNVASEYRSMTPIGLFSDRSQPIQEFCFETTYDAKKFFGLELNEYRVCMTDIEQDRNTKFVAKNSTLLDESRLVGKIPSSTKRQQFSFLPISKVFVPEDNEVLPDSASGYLDAASVKFYRSQGMFHHARGALPPLQVFFEFSPITNRFEVGGVFEGQLYLDIFRPTF